MSDAEIARQLKIKTGIVKRLRKELALYQQEQKDYEAKVQALKDEGSDPHDIKYAVSWVHAPPSPSQNHPRSHPPSSPTQPISSLSPLIPFYNSVSHTHTQENILSESAAMVPDTQQRLESAFNELQNLVDECSTSPSDELRVATQELEETKSIF
jgi:cell pole-organizing protein PopZ